MNDRYSGIIESIFSKAIVGNIKLITSPITLIEVLIKPIKDGNDMIAEEYLRIFRDSDEIVIKPLDIEVAKKSAEIRTRYNLRVPDAIQVSTALIGGASYFLTNDIRLKKVKDIKMIILEDLID